MCKCKTANCAQKRKGTQESATRGFLGVLRQTLRAVRCRLDDARVRRFGSDVGALNLKDGSTSHRPICAKARTGRAAVTTAYVNYTGRLYSADAPEQKGPSSTRRSGAGRSRQARRRQ